MSDMNAKVLVATIISKNIKTKEGIKEKLREAMELSYDENCNWMVTNENDRFGCACGAAILVANAEDKEKIQKEMKVLQSLSAMLSGIPVDMSQVLDGYDADSAIGLMAIWNEVKEKRVAEGKRI